MSAEPQALLASLDGDPVPLKGVTARGRLHGLLFELTVEQRYFNPHDKAIEAVFTFPLPSRAVLLGFDLEIGDRKLSAVAIARQAASERYEKAIDQGDTAALIEHDGNGLYTVSLGNLLAAETAVIRYRYAELLDAHEGHVRLNIPTVIAPRYGDPADAGLGGPTIPGVDVLGEYPFAVTLELIGITDTSSIRSPSHKITTSVGENALTVSLSRAGFLDRDFVLELDAASMPQHSLVAKDGDGHVLLTSTALALDTHEQRPLALKVLLDCSGSMGGDSIAAAKRALLAIIDRLTPADRISLTRFGSTIHHVTEGLEPADEHTLTPLKALVRRADADLGGTEMGAALKATLAIPTPQSITPDLILITDGEIYDIKGVVDAASRAGHRLFAIAIGAAPNEALARALAEKTAGACEFVGPTEDAEAIILRTFKRLRSTQRTLATVNWPGKTTWTAPLPTAVFPGDTLHLMAGFTSKPTGSTDLTVADSNGQSTAIHVPTAADVMTDDLIPRLAAARRLASLPEAEARALAVQYQLASDYTSFVVVVERVEGEKADSLPATVAIQHMLAAGWGGTSHLEFPETPAYRLDEDDRHFLIPLALDTLPDIRRCAASPREVLPDFDGDRPFGELPPISFDSEERATLLVSIAEYYARTGALPSSLAELLAACELPADIGATLAAVIARGADEADVITTFIAVLARTAPPESFSDADRKIFEGGVFRNRRFRELRRCIEEALS